MSMPITSAMPVSRVHAAGARHRHRAAPVRAQRKQVITLLRSLLQSSLELCVDPSSSGAPRLRLADSRFATLDHDLLQSMISDGLLAVADHSLRATGQTAAALRRVMCDVQDETYAAQHRTVENTVLPMPDGKALNVRKNLRESPLFPLMRLREKDGGPFLPSEAVAAGERLAADFEFGGLQPRITASWEPRLSSRLKSAPGAGTELSDSSMAARKRVNLAIEAMGPELAGVALDICCFGKGLETVERERSWPSRSAKLMLRTALLALARHYAPPPARPRSQSWSDGDGGTGCERQNRVNRG